MTRQFRSMTLRISLILSGVILAMAAVTSLDTTTARAVSPAGACIANPLGPAADYNVFVSGNFTSTASDTQGRLAAGGNVSLTNYSIGATLAPADASRDTLIVGGALNFHAGAVAHGNAVSHGTGTLEGVTFTSGNGYRQGTALDFGAAANTLRSDATGDAALPVNGTTAFQYNQITLTGTDSRLNIFTVSGANLSMANSLTINAPAGSTALVNISGDTVRLQNEGFALHGVERTHVLYNFPQATALTLSNVGIDGSILAPFAAIAFDNGAITGQLIGASLTGSGQANNAPFAGCLPASSPTSSPTPTPTSCQQFQAILRVTGTTKSTATLVADPTPQRTSLPIGATVYYRVVDPATDAVLSAVRSVKVTQSPAGFGTISVPLAPFRKTTDPQGQYAAEVSSRSDFPAVTTPLGSCTVRTTFILSGNTSSTTGATMVATRS